MLWMTNGFVVGLGINFGKFDRISEFLYCKCESNQGPQVLLFPCDTAASHKRTEL